MDQFGNRYVYRRLRFLGPIAAIGLAGATWLLGIAGIVSIVMIGQVTARCAFSTQNFDTCVADAMGSHTLVREGSHTHWVVKTTPHALLGLIVTSIGLWIATLICGAFAWRFLDTAWSDPNASLFPKKSRDIRS